ncbi:MAG: hypothetical protein KGM18_03905 [Sphingomonadales bacterium]|nr:hypothetical protein [Sphingomonadales bacterium]
MQAEDPGAKRLARLAVLPAAMVYVALAMISGLDRAAADDPRIDDILPGGLAAEAHLTSARAALERGDGNAALNESERALSAAPVDPASSATLGAARAALHDTAGADQAFRIAGSLGWRIFYTQAYWIQRALAVGDYRVATLRLDALARQSPALLRQRQLIDPFEASPPARAALAERLAVAPWRNLYAGEVEGLEPDQLGQRALVLESLANRGTELGCDPIAPMVSALIARGALVQAASLWRGHCRHAGSKLIYDGNFAAATIDHDRSDFAWSFLGQRDVSLLLSPDGAGQAVMVDSTAMRRIPFMRQLLLVPPGRYKLTWRARTDGGQPSAMAVPAIYCLGLPEVVIDPRFDRLADAWSGEVTIDNACPAHWLSFTVNPGPARFSLSRVALEPEDQATHAP